MIPAAEVDGSFVAARRPGVCTVEMEGEAVLLDEAGGVLHLLEPVATVVWSHLDGVRSLDQLAAELTEAYGAEPASVATDVVLFARQLGRWGLLEGVEPEGDVQRV